MSVYLQVFGSPRVLHDGMPVVCDTRKGVALLAHLGVPERGWHRTPSPSRRTAPSCRGWH